MALRELDLDGCNNMTDVGVQHLTSLTSLMTLYLDRCYRIKDEGANCLGRLVSLRDLDLRASRGMRGARLEHWESLTSLTKLHLYNCSEFTDKGMVWLGKLVGLRVLDLYWCYQITDVGVPILGAIDICHKIGIVPLS